MANLSNTQKTLLQQVESASKSEPGYLLIDKSKNLDALKEAGLIDIGTVPGTKQVAVRLVNGASEPPVNGAANGAAEPDAIAKFAAFPVLAGIPMAPASKGSVRKEEYPFSLMNIGDSFLVPVSDKMPKPWESFASTVSSATRRFSEKSETEFRVNKNTGVKTPKLIPTKRFTLRRVVKGTKYANGYEEPSDGARVFRTE